MEEDIDSTSGTSMVPIALALLAIVLGGAGLYFGMSANQRLAPLSESVDEGTSFSAQVEKDIGALQTRISELSAQNEQLKSALQRLGRESSQTLRVAKGSESGVAANREEIVKLAQVMQQLANSGASRAQPTPRTTTAEPSTVSEPPNASDASNPASVYTIQSGDTLGKIASQKGVGLNALLDANPDADPRRLSIGQQINIPANE